MKQLMHQVQGGDEDAFTVLFDRYHRLVLVTGLKIVRDVGEAQEVTRNVFLEFSVGTYFRRAVRLPLPPKKQARPNR